MIIANSIGSSITKLLIHSNLVGIFIHLSYSTLRFLSSDANFRRLRSILTLQRPILTITPITILPNPTSNHMTTILNHKRLFIIIPNISSINRRPFNILIIIINIRINGYKMIRIIIIKKCNIIR